jgi:hypothetical protein
MAFGPSASGTTISGASNRSTTRSAPKVVTHVSGTIGSAPLGETGNW